MNRPARARLLRFAAALAMFQKGLSRRDLDVLLGRAEDDGEPRRIRCPHCAWHPDASSLWYCADCRHPEGFVGGCGAAWNTFETSGLCPGCGHWWRWTSCLRCGLWALHAEWYGDAGRS
jgi:hypothetical protein